MTAAATLTRVLALLAVLFCVPLLAQTTREPLTLQSLSRRIDELEKRVANDEASGTNIPPLAGDGTASATSSAAAATAQKVAALQQEVGEIEEELGGAPPARPASTPATAATLKAPFRVVDQAGRPIFTVESLQEGVRVYGADHSSVGIGSTAQNSGLLIQALGADGAGAAGIRVYSPNSGTPVAGMSAASGAGRLWANSGQGSALIGAPAAGPFGVRVYGADAKTAVAGLVADAQGNGSLSVNQGGKARISLGVRNGSGFVGVLDDAGQTYLAVLTNHSGGGGAVQLANPSGQIVAFMDANPTNNQGRAAFTDSGGQPLVRIGAAGSHGDVLIGGADKVFDLWTRMILP